MCVSPTKRLRRSEQALKNAESALAAAEENSAEGFEKVNSKRLSEAQAMKEAAVAAKKEAGGAVEEGEGVVGEGDWRRATEETLEKELSDAKEAFSHSKSYVIGGYDKKEKLRK